MTWTRVAFMLGLIAVGLVLTRVTGQTNPKVSEERAVEIASSRVTFEPEGHNVRLVRQGIPPRPSWAVSFWIRAASGGYRRITLVLVDASTGRILQVHQSA